MGDDTTDRNLERLLRARHADAVEPSPEFIANLGRKLVGSSGNAARPVASPTSPPARRWLWLIPAAAALLIAVFVLHGVPHIELISGNLADAAGSRFAPGSRVPARKLVSTSSGARLGLGDVAQVDVGPGGAIAIFADGEISQTEGAVRYDVAAERELKVETPRGTLEAHASSFIIRVESGAMSKSAVTVAAVTAAVVAGGALVWHWNSPGTSGGTLRVGPGESATVPGKGGEGAVDTAPVRSGDMAEVAAIKARNDDLASENASLRKAARENELELARLRTEVKEGRQRKGVTIAAVMAQIDDLKKNGLKSLLDSVTTAQLVSDLKSLGAEGTAAVLGLLASKDENERFLAARLLENLGDPAAVAGLTEAALHDKSEMVANMASHALMVAPGPEALAACQKIYAEAQGDGAKLNALFGMANHGDPRGVDLSLEYIKNTKNSEQYRQALAMGFMVGSDERYLPLVEAAMESLKGEHVTQMAINYFKSLNSPAGRAQLQAIADNPNAPAALRDAALAALK